MIKRALSVFSVREKIYLLLVSILATGLILVATSRYGLGVSTDGLHYLSAADNLAQGDGLVDYKGAPLDSWAPALSTLMAGIHLITQVSTLNSAGLINIVSVVASIFVMALMIKNMKLGNPIWFYLGPLAFALLSSSISLAANVSTEPIFVLVILLFMLSGRDYYERRDRRSLIIMGLFASVAALIRWVGVTLAFSGVIFLLVLHWREIGRWIKESFLFGVISSVPFVLWVVGRNYRLVGNFVGPRQTQVDYVEPLGNLKLFYARMLEWFLPNSLSKRLDIGLIVIGLVIVLLYLNKSEGIKSWWRGLTGSSNLILFVFTTFYYIFMVFVVATREHTETYDDRYLLPIFIPLFLILFDLAEKLILPYLRGKTKWLNLAMAFGAVLWLTYHAALTARFLRFSTAEGVPYYNHFNTIDYRESIFLRNLAQTDFEVGIPIYSNDSAAVYFYTGERAKNSPTDSENYVAADETVVAETEGWPREEKAYLAWLLPNWKKHYYSPEQLRKNLELDELLIYEDGGLYLVTQ